MVNGKMVITMGGNKKRKEKAMRLEVKYTAFSHLIMLLVHLRIKSVTNGVMNSNGGHSNPMWDGVCRIDELNRRKQGRK